MDTGHKETCCPKGGGVRWEAEREREKYLGSPLLPSARKPEDGVGGGGGKRVLHSPEQSRAEDAREGEQANNQALEK